MGGRVGHREAVVAVVCLSTRTSDGHGETTQAWRIGRDPRIGTWWNYLTFAFGCLGPASHGASRARSSGGAVWVLAVAPGRGQRGATVTVKAWTPVEPWASVRRSVKLNVPAVVGVPVTRTRGPSRLSWTSVIPGGSRPAVLAQV